MSTHYVEGLPNPGRSLVMGVLNVTPDSFSDGGLWFDKKHAIEHGHGLIAEGADIVDVGGESTRPGAEQVSDDEQLTRILPVIDELAKTGSPISVDTMSANVAEQAVRKGAAIVNDVSGGLADPRMLRVVADLKVPYVCMHWRGQSKIMNERAVYDDVVDDVVYHLTQRIEAAVGAGIEPGRIIIDPGLGFGKEPEHNWALLQNLDRLIALGHPVLVGGSRKRFIGQLLADPVTGEPRPADDRDAAGTAFSALAARDGAWCIRSHVVRATLDAVLVAGRWAG